MTDQQKHSFVVHRQRRDIISTKPKDGDQGGLLAQIMTATLSKAISEAIEQQSASNQGTNIGLIARPFDFAAAKGLMLANIHHQRCIHTKVRSHVGLGHKNDAVSDALDPLCTNSWLDTLCDVSEDYYHVGNGYLEVVRKEPHSDAPITGLHHIPAEAVHIFVEDERARNWHFQVDGDGYQLEIPFSRYGQLESFLGEKRQQHIMAAGSMSSRGKGSSVSEVIHFRRPSALHRFFGYPEHLAATVAIEVVQMLHQHTFDFFLNRGVPELLVNLIGAVDRDQFEDLKTQFQNSVGLGNTHKTMLSWFDGMPENIKLEVHKLAMEGRSDATTFSSMSDTLSLEIVSAHSVPPLLAGIQIPGKLGATNELPNALMAFQALCIGQDQVIFEHTLGNTLGNDLYNGGLGLKKDSWKFKTILETIDLGMASVVGGMRQTVPEARAEGRDLSAGMKD